MRKTALACPVCGKYMDVLDNADNDFTTCILASEGRAKHKAESPDCASHFKWILGWDLIPVANYEEID